MACTVLVGLQWGDEGKGKIIDVLTETSDVVVRFQGGNNAGHTVEVGDTKFVLHLVPSGVVREGVLCIIGNGVVVDPIGLATEIAELQSKGVELAGRLQISARCHLVFCYHRLRDASSERQLGERKIGTTKRGIGPAYADKVNRVGLRAEAMRDRARLETEFRLQAEAFNRTAAGADEERLDVDAEWHRLEPVAELLAPMVCDTALSLDCAVAAGKEILFEGAQGTWLDVDFGTYPFVTSSNTTAGAACTGGGLAPNRIDSVIGVAKAYTTRVGSGPFPTELTDELGEFLRQEGAEFGATTGRPRRCGWFDAVATRYAAMLNGARDLAVTKLDVLDSLQTVRICTAYELDGRILTDMPTDSGDLARATPVYEDMPGWEQPTAEAQSWDELPARAREYLVRLADLVRADLSIISIGPKRRQTFALKP